MKILNIIPLFFAFSTFAQIGISTKANFVMHPDAAVHIDNGNHVVKFPHVSLQGLTDNQTVNNPSVGLMVYNTNNDVAPRKGFCYWDGDKWINYADDQVIISNDIDLVDLSVNMLGYNPDGSYIDATDTFSITRSIDNKVISFTYEGCVTNPDNNHTYCGYSSSEPLNWMDAFKAGKIQKGYLVTITSQKEWDFILNTFYRNQHSLTGVNFKDLINDNRRVWIGYNKVNPIGYHQQFTWITGESSEVDWFSGTRFTGFAPNEPNDSQGDEGCSHIHYVNDAVVNRDLNKLSWNDTPCNLATHPSNYAGMAPKFVIIEFNQ